MDMILFIGLSIGLSLLSMPIIIGICKKLGLYDYHDERKIHSGDIPRLGGVGIVIAFVISSLLFLITKKTLNTVDHIPIYIAAGIIFVFAIVDDLLNLPAIVKLIVQLVAVSIVTFNGYHFTQIFGWQLPKAVAIILTFGWILGVTNAYNLIDGLDGLCGTLSITAILTMGILYYLSGNNEAILCFMLAGAIFGFLCFNWPPAKLFMGDNGSQFLGFMIATLPLYTSGDVFEYNKFLIMIVLTSFAVFDTIAAIWRRIRDRKPIMSGDRSHLHHKLLNMGYTKKSALYLIAFIQVLLCISVIVSYFLGRMKGMALLLESFSFMVLFFSIIHYTNRRVMLQKEAEKAEANKNQENKSEN
ncbi:MAG: undecaprenyl/decaprenyl-phosphate alpha-N-acetylglucosaminyl 1-phosphate transferase [Treponema sp.]|nr:undecaprenyl/decaprenyl-phosphate alpha-N-acetylglucosaminyl 1-phosphate transferase [Treponema sp.]